jgi:regulatory protein
MRETGGPLTTAALITKLARFCAYRERSHKEVEQKLRELKADAEQAGEVMVEMIRLGFLNEERFARAYARGKFRMLGWGREKIRQGLEQENLQSKLISLAIKGEIDQEEYLGCLRQTAEKKAATLPDLKQPGARQKLRDFLLRKGFESSLIDSEIRFLSTSNR